MPSPRRKRFVLLLIVLTILVVIYLTTGAESTKSSPFYKKTVALMDSRAAQARQDQNGGPTGRQTSKPLPERKDENAAQTPEEEQADATDRLKSRLKEAEVAAKKSADDKWKNAADRPDIMVDAAKAGKPRPKLEKVAVELANERSVAGRKKYPAPADQTVGSEDGIAHVGPQVDSTKALGANQDREEEEQEEQEEPLDLTAAAQEELTHLLSKSPILIFSKSYCPHSARAKRILQSSYTIKPAPVVVELDLHELGHEMQGLLLERTGRRTVPNVMVAGRSIGGGDDMQELWLSGRMEAVLREVGGTAIKSVVLNHKAEEGTGS